MLPSPYSPGALPVYLAGRGTELETIRARLARTGMLGRSGGPLLAFHGSRGLGKTSLLRAAQREAAAAGYLTVWVTGRDDVALAPDLAASLTEEISRRSTGQKAKGLLQNLSKVQIEVGLPGAKVGVEANRTRASAVVERNLADAGRFARQHDHHGLAVFVDEFQEAQLSDRRSLLIALQHFDGAPEGCPVAIIAAGLPSLLAAVPEAATFGERTDFVEIGLLGDVAVAEALRLPAHELGVSWSDDAIIAAIEAAAGYPHRVQLIGDAAWEAGRPGSGDVIGLAQVRMGAERADRRMAALFRSRMAKINPEQRRVVMAMAELGDQPVSRAAVAGRLGITSEALSRPRQELINRGLIESAGRGLLRFTIPGFAGFLRTAVDLD
ncbi:ATP-binding protein [Mycolicibacterium hodleri]|uniref:ATP/GTP-binding protein n=1 Tax=Mycolicibacterium hodleri TaxID=49897 RepID=A0A502E654_9MYCO|nr:ATP-binding protein [Mycolicibacterium hodleri]TPG32834.1 ATP/GTP-binding protein [Mycolicibacterium hodleri]